MSNENGSDICWFDRDMVIRLGQLSIPSSFEILLESKNLVFNYQYVQ